MKIREAIDKANDSKPNQIDEEVMMRWLLSLDTDIMENVIGGYNLNDGESEIVMGDYSIDSTDLVVPAPYDDLYVEYLRMMIDKANDETARYNNSVIFYNDAYVRFTKWWNKNHIHKGSRTVHGRNHY